MSRGCFSFAGEPEANLERIDPLAAGEGSKGSGFCCGSRNDNHFELGDGISETPQAEDDYEKVPPPVIVSSLDIEAVKAHEAEEEEKAKQRKILNTMTSTLSTWVQNQEKLSAHTCLLRWAHTLDLEEQTLALHSHQGELAKKAAQIEQLQAEAAALEAQQRGQTTGRKNARSLTQVNNQLEAVQINILSLKKELKKQKASVPRLKCRTPTMAQQLQTLELLQKNNLALAEAQLTNSCDPQNPPRRNVEDVPPSTPDSTAAKQESLSTRSTPSEPRSARSTHSEPIADAYSKVADLIAAMESTPEGPERQALEQALQAAMAQAVSPSNSPPVLSSPPGNTGAEF